MSNFSAYPALPSDNSSLACCQYSDLSYVKLPIRLRELCDFTSKSHYVICGFELIIYVTIMWSWPPDLIIYVTIMWIMWRLCDGCGHFAPRGSVPVAHRTHQARCWYCHPRHPWNFKRDHSLHLRPNSLHTQRFPGAGFWHLWETPLLFGVGKKKKKNRWFDSTWFVG